MLKKLVKVVCVLSLISCIVSLGYNYYPNYILEKEYVVYDNSYPYEEAFINGELDLDEIKAVLPDCRNFMELDYYPTTELVTPITISYYENIGDTEPIYTIEKDTELFVDTPLEKSNATFQGWYTLPTTEAGWRYSRPFSIVGREDNMEFYYVKLSELEEVAERWTLENYIISEKEEYNNSNNNSEYEALMNFTLFDIDGSLYVNGYYISPNLYQPIVTTTTYIAMGCFLLSLGFYIFFYKKNKMEMMLNHKKTTLGITVIAVIGISTLAYNQFAPINSDNTQNAGINMLSASLNEEENQEEDLFAGLTQSEIDEMAQKQDAALAEYDDLMSYFEVDVYGVPIYPAEYAGEYIDENNRLVVQMTEAFDMEEVLNYIKTSSYIDVKYVTYSYNELIEYKGVADALYDLGITPTTDVVGIVENAYCITLSKAKLESLITEDKDLLIEAIGDLLNDQQIQYVEDALNIDPDETEDGESGPIIFSEY